MSEQNDDELELQALRRQLDDAFATTRPRRGFDEELWARMQARRPATSRLAAAFAAAGRAVRAVPPAPVAAIAAVLVVVIAVGLIGLNLPHGGGGNAASAPANDRFGANNGTAAGQFGRLPSPQFSSAPRTVPKGATQGPSTSVPAPADYAGPMTVSWTGQLNVPVTSVPVYRYAEPSTGVADQFASALGAVLTGRPSGFLGSYDSADYTLKVRGTVAAPPQGPAYFVLSMPNLPAVATVGGPDQAALEFLAEHNLVPSWAYTVDVQPGSAGLTRVTLQRQFDAGADGTAYLVDSNGARYGLEVDLDGARPVTASGPLPLAMDTANYPIIASDAAVRAALATSTAGPGAPSTTPALKLDQAELVYVLVPAGAHSFYEPAYLFSGSLVYNGVTYSKRLLIPAIDPSQLS